MKKIIILPQVLAIALIFIFQTVGFSQNDIHLILENSQADQDFYDNRALEEVNFLPGYDFLTNALTEEYASPKMNGRIDFSIIGAAQSGGVLSESDMDSSIDTSKPVINLSGSTSVSASGGAIYSLPIVLPIGTAGMEPSISVNYNSQGGSGLLGQGWNLSAVSAITRVPKNIYNDGEVIGVQMDISDVFAMDGNRLMVTNGGDYGAHGTQYGTEVETYARITSIDANANGIPDYFKVETKDGKELTYGKRYHLGSVPYSWMLTRVEDAYGNYMKYEYLVDDDQIRLDEIVYTGNDQAGLAPYNRVQFHYIERQDKNTAYMNGYPVKSNILLDFIDIRYEDNLFKKYHFDYGFTNGKSFLNEIVESGAEGTELNPLQFVYDIEEINQIKSILDPELAPSNSKFSYGDFNGDGLCDYIKFYTYISHQTNHITGYQVFLNEGVDSFIGGGIITFNDNLFIDEWFGTTVDIIENITGAQITNSNFFFNSLLTGEVSYLVGDYNGDGKDDFFLYHLADIPNDNAIWLNRVKVFLSSGDDFVEEIITIGKRYERNNVFDISKIVMVGDFDGNGALDFYIEDFDNNEQSIYSFSTEETIENIDLAYHYTSQENDYIMLDYNGDGKTDIMSIHEDGATIISRNGATGNLELYEDDFPTTENSGIKVGDFNGDGKSDLVLDDNGTTTIALSNGEGGFELIPIPLGYNDFLYPIDIDSDGFTDIVGLSGMSNPAGCISQTSEEEVDVLHDNVLYIDDNGEVYGENEWGEIQYQPYYTTHIQQVTTSVAQFQRYCRYNVYLNNKNTQFFYDSPISFNYDIGSLVTESDEECGSTTNVAINDFQLASSFDLNGDGYMELKTLNVSTYISLFQNENHQSLLKVKNSFGLITNLFYKPLTNETVYTKGGVLQYPLNVDPRVYPLNLIQPALFVVSEVNTKNNLGGDNIIQYKYENALLHKEGRGFLGFLKTYNQNFTTNGDFNDGEMNINTFNYDPIYFILELKHRKSYNVFNPVNSPFESNYLNSSSSFFTDFFDAGNNRIGSKINRTENRTYFEGIITSKIVSNYIINNATGNSEVITTRINDDYQTSIMTNVYDTYGGWGIDNRVINTTSSVVRIGKPTISTIQTFDYNTQGSLIQKVDNSSELKNVTTNITEYNEFGLPLSSEITAEGEGAPSLQESSLEYDSKGRFVIKTINPLEQESTTDYHPIWGGPSSKTDITGNTTTYQYNEWGQAISSTEPNGKTTATSIEWLTGDPDWGSVTVNSTNDACYQTIIVADGAPEVSETYNRFGMKLKTATASHFGAEVIKITTYNNLGQIVTVSEPHFGGISHVQVTQSYDEYGRVTSSTSNLAGIETTYGYSFTDDNLWKTTVVSPNGTTESYKDVTGLVIHAQDATGQDLYYEFYSDSQPEKVWLNEIGTGTLLSTITYDELRNQKTLVDPNAGTTEYWYNAVGQLYKQEDGNGNTFEMTFDVIGRTVSKTIVEPGNTDVYSYEYITEGNGLNALKKVTAPNGYYTEYEYGDYNRVMSVTEDIEGLDYTTSYEYDNYGRVIRKEYPSGFAVRNTYTNEGFLNSVVTDDNATTIWMPENQNAKGIYTTFVLGNGYETSTSFDSKGMPINIITVNDANSHIQNLNMGWANNGNMEFRHDIVKGLEESFDYDNNRLSGYQVTDLNPMTVTYQPNGNIDSKTDAGEYTYALDGALGKPHAVNSIDNPAGIISTLPQPITYTNFNSTKTITQDLTSLTIEYGAGQQRRSQIFDTDGDITTTTFVGAYEKNEKDGITREVNYISGGNGICAMWVIEDGLGSMYYLYRDHLGSIVTVTDAVGNIEYEQNFDPWGRYRNPDTWQYLNEGEPEDRELGDDNIADWVDEIASPDWSWFRRGYTGHEMLPEFGLINMNGRAYNPVLARMLQVDNYVQNPFSSQSYNRYSYVLNNPLKYTDPSGEFIIPMLLGAAIGGYVGGAMQQGEGGLSRANWNVSTWNNAWPGIVSGAITGAGIGLAVAGGLAGLGFEIKGVTNGFSPGIYKFSGVGKTTLGWDVAYNSIVTGNINILSNVIQGNSWEQTAMSGATGLVAGAIGAATTIGLRSNNFPMSVKAIRRQNYYTSIINGAGDRFYRSIDKNLSDGKILSNTLLGALEGGFMAYMVNAPEYTFGNQEPISTDLLNFRYLNSSYKSRSFARYASGIISQAGTSVPGVGFQLGATYYSVVGGHFLFEENVLGIAFSSAFLSSVTSVASLPFRWSGLWDNYEEIGGFRPYTIFGQ